MTLIKGSSRSASASYGSYIPPNLARNKFNAQISILVPQIDANRNASNDYSGASISVEFVADNNSIGCPRHVYETHIVQDNGTVLLDGQTTVLQKYITGSEIHLCTYNVISFEIQDLKLIPGRSSADIFSETQVPQ